MQPRLSLNESDMYCRDEKQVENCPTPKGCSLVPGGSTDLNMNIEDVDEYYFPAADWRRNVLIKNYAKVFPVRSATKSDQWRRFNLLHLHKETRIQIPAVLLLLALTE